MHRMKTCFPARSTNLNVRTDFTLITKTVQWFSTADTATSMLMKYFFCRLLLWHLRRSFLYCFIYVNFKGVIVHPTIQTFEQLLVAGEQYWIIVVICSTLSKQIWVVLSYKNVQPNGSTFYTHWTAYNGDRIISTFLPVVVPSARIGKKEERGGDRNWKMIFFQFSSPFTGVGAG